MLIKGALAQKIIQRTGLGHNVSHTRSQILHSGLDKEEKHKLLKSYDRLIGNRTMEKHEVKELLSKLSDKKIINITGTYLHTIAHNPERVVSWAKHTVKAEDHERQQEQMRVEKEQLAHLEKADVPATAQVGAHHTHEPQMKDGKTPLPAHIKAA